MLDILIVVDMQNDFVDGSLGTPEARRIVAPVAARIDEANRRGAAVYFTLDTHPHGYLESAEGRALPVEHCLRGTRGHDLVPDIAARAEGALLFEKPTFGSTKLADELAGVARRERTTRGAGMRIELCGLCTDICVVSNALVIKARLPEAQLFVQSRLCAGSTPDRHRAALDVLRSCQVQVID